MKKYKVLFLCTGNSCRSQMAEGWAKNLLSDKIDVFSAGIETHGLNPNAVQVMQEVGVDISDQKSQLLSEFDDIDFDIVLTVCSNAHDTCPIFPRDAKVIHFGFDDPPKLAKEAKSEEEAMDCYRKVRDDIKTYLSTFDPEALLKKS